MGMLQRRMAGRFQLVTDNWHSYSGRGGGSVRDTFGENVDFLPEAFGTWSNTGDGGWPDGQADDD